MIGLLFTLAALPLAEAQVALQPTPLATDPAAEAAAEKPPSASRELDALITAIEDPEARAALLDRLRAAQATAAQPADGATAAAKPDQVAADVIDELSTEFQRRTDGLFAILGDVAHSLDQLPVLANWVAAQVGDREQRTVWVSVTSAVLLIISTGLVARWLVLRLRPRLDSRQPRRSCLRRSAVEIAAAIVFAVLTLGVISLASLVAARYRFELEPVTNASLVLVAFLFAAMLWRAVVRLLFGDAQPAIRLWPVGEQTAEVARTGLIRIGRLSFIGTGLLIAMGQLGLPNSLFQFVLHGLYIVVAGLAIILVLRLTETVAEAIRLWSDESRSALARFVPSRFLARTWQYIAILLIMLHYLVWALKVPGGIGFLSRATIATLAILAIARFASLGIDRLAAHGVPRAVEGQELSPELQERANRYVTPLLLVLRGAVLLLAFIAIATAWNTGILEWLKSASGLAFVGLVARLVLVVGIAAVAIEVTGIVAHRIVDATNEQGKPLHSNRVRTLATIFANVLYFIFGLTGLFLSLSTLGVETAPLLAGAGVVGLAVGFGSQALVKDLITGLFILLGDTLRVGDVVEITGRSGVVESMSMRTITLRGYDGNVHTVPYGSIDVVTNMTKDYSYALFDIEIAYKENTDEVVRVIRELDDRLRKEWPWRRLILEPIDVAGVDNFGNSAVAIRMRSKTRPGEQWGVRRELLRRIKLRFDELGIEIPYPHQTLYFGRNKDGSAPPLQIEAASRELRLATDDAAPEPAIPAASLPLTAVAANRGRVGGD